MDIINKTLSEVTKEEFMEIIMEKFTDYLPEKYQQFRLNLDPFHKLNGVQYGIHLLPPDHDSTDKHTVSPIVYIDEMYEQWSTESISTALRMMAKLLTQNVMEISKTELSLDNAIENIVFAVVNTEANPELLEKAPHRSFLDLSIIFKWILDESMRTSIIITYDMAEKMRLDEITLYNLAKGNTKRLMTPNIISMHNLLTEISEADVGEDTGRRIWILGNKKNLYGASSILYKDMLQELADKLESDLFIIPSSIHELLVLPEVDGHTADFISGMVNEVNTTQLKPEERLSNSVYYFSRETGKVSIAKESAVGIVG